MSQPRHVADLLHQLQGIDSPLKRLKILARAWRSVRALTPAERRGLAEQLQLEGADRLLEQLGLRDGVAPAVVLEAVHRAEAMDPDRLRELLAGTPEEGGPGTFLHQVMDRAASRQIDVAQLLAPVSEGAASPASSRPEGPDVPPAAEPVTALELPSGPPPVEEVLPPGVHSAEHADASVTPPSPSREAVQERTSLQRFSSDPAHRHTRSPSELDVPEDEGLPSHHHRKSSLVTRLCHLRLRARGTALNGAGRQALLEVVEQFPPGWARRRAVQALLEAGLPDDLPTALELAAAAGTPAGEIWCLSTLVRSRSLSDTALAEVVIRAKTSAARKRLAALARRT